jgi:hypothetical protein
VEYRTLTPDAADYPAKLRARLGADAPTLYCHGPLKLLDRFCLAVICSDNNPGHCYLESNQLLFTIRDYALNYVGGWQAFMEMEIFRLSLDAPQDPRGIRSTTMFTSRGLAHEDWDNYLDDRWGPVGPFRDFPQKREYYRRANEGELLVVSTTEPGVKRMLRANILQMNLVACALADLVYVPFADKGSKTMISVKRALKLGIPMLTVNMPQNNFLLELGIPTCTRKTVGTLLESMGASRDGAPPFPKPDQELPSIEECVRRSAILAQEAREALAQRKAQAAQTTLFDDSVGYGAKPKKKR